MTVKKHCCMEQRERELNQNKNFSEIKMLEITEKLCRI